MPNKFHFDQRVPRGSMRMPNIFSPSFENKHSPKLRISMAWIIYTYDNILVYCLQSSTYYLIFIIFKNGYHFEDFHRQTLSHEAKCLHHSVVQRANVSKCHGFGHSVCTTGGTLGAVWAASGILQHGGWVETTNLATAWCFQWLGSRWLDDPWIAWIERMIAHPGCRPLEKAT